MIKKLIKPLLDEAYNKGFSAGVNAEKLVKAKTDTEREYNLVLRGKELGREELLKELEKTEIEEISAKEFNDLNNLIKPFGFIGTIDDIGLVLDEAN